jgi:uncharacterized membrane protein YhiD involved in acid resistance
MTAPRIESGSATTARGFWSVILFGLAFGLGFGIAANVLALIAAALQSLLAR